MIRPLTVSRSSVPAAPEEIFFFPDPLWLSCSSCVPDRPDVVLLLSHTHCMIFFPFLGFYKILLTFFPPLTRSAFVSCMLGYGDELVSFLF